MSFPIEGIYPDLEERAELYAQTMKGAGVNPALVDRIAAAASGSNEIHMLMAIWYDTLSEAVRKCQSIESELKMLVDTGDYE